MASKKDKILDVAVDNPAASIQEVADMAGASYHYTYKVMRGFETRKTKKPIDIPASPKKEPKPEKPKGFLKNIKSFFDTICPRY